MDRPPDTQPDISNLEEGPGAGTGGTFLSLTDLFPSAGSEAHINSQPTFVVDIPAQVPGTAQPTPLPGPTVNESFGIGDQWWKDFNPPTNGGNGSTVNPADTTLSGGGKPGAGIDFDPILTGVQKLGQIATSVVGTISDVMRKLKGNEPTPTPQARSKSNTGMVILVAAIITVTVVFVGRKVFRKR